MKYKIEKETTFRLKKVDSETSIVEETSYYIKYQKTIWGIFKYWKYLEYEDCKYHDCIGYPIDFPSLEEAEEFGKKYISKGVLPDTVTVETVTEFHS